jgi:SAM-dependent methyltransferase
LEPESNLDVPFVPTDEKVVEAMLEMGGVGPKDLLYDLGCGDGRIVVAAAKVRGARAVGIDMDPLRIEEAREYAEWMGADHMVEFIEDDLFCADFSKATVVTMYLLHTVNLELRPHLLSGLRPGTRVISHAFDMGAWKADEKLSAGGASIFKWIIPAPVQGAWEWQTTDGRRYRVELEQEFQQVSGRAWIDGEAAHMESVVLRGPRLEMAIQENDKAPLETFVMRYEDNQLHPTAGSKQATVAVMVPLAP